jgi:Fe2+ transport system protein FeoA
MNLSQLETGSSAMVKSIDSGVRQAKLAEMGLFSGKVVKVMFKAPLGDPIAVSLDGYVLALRKDEASTILIETIL